MIAWRRIPWPLWAYGAVVLLGTSLVEVNAHGPIPAKVLLAAVMLAWLYLLLRGVRWVWIATVGIYVLGLVAEVISGSLDWQSLILSLVGLTLLVLPVTQRYFSVSATDAEMSRPARHGCH
jgi:hypothetical protein